MEHDVLMDDIEEELHENPNDDQVKCLVDKLMMYLINEIQEEGGNVRIFLNVFIEGYEIKFGPKISLKVI